MNKNKKMRHLNAEERRLVMRSKDERNRQKKYNEYLIKYNELMLNEGLDMNMYKQRMGFQKALKEVNEESNMNNEVIKELDRQLKYGVKVIPPKKEEDVEKDITEKEVSE